METKPETIDLSDGGPIIDIAEGGYMDFDDAFKTVLYELSTRSPSPSKRDKVKITASNLLYPRNKMPERIEVLKTYTVGYLFLLHKRWFEKDFDAKAYNDETERRWNVFEKQAEGRSAWGMYSNYMHNLKVKEEHKRIEQLPEKERAIAKEKTNRGCVMFIG